MPTWQQVNLLLVKEEKLGSGSPRPCSSTLVRVITIHPLGTKNGCTKFHANPSYSCWTICLKDKKTGFKGKLRGLSNSKGFILLAPWIRYTDEDLLLAMLSLTITAQIELNSSHSLSLSSTFCFSFKVKVSNLKKCEDNLVLFYKPPNQYRGGEI